LRECGALKGIWQAFADTQARIFFWRKPRDPLAYEGSEGCPSAVGFQFHVPQECRFPTPYSRKGDAGTYRAGGGGLEVDAAILQIFLSVECWRGRTGSY